MRRCLLQDEYKMRNLFRGPHKHHSVRTSQTSFRSEDLTNIIPFRGPHKHPSVQRTSQTSFLQRLVLFFQVISEEMIQGEKLTDRKIYANWCINSALAFLCKYFLYKFFKQILKSIINIMFVCYFYLGLSVWPAKLLFTSITRGILNSSLCSFIRGG